MRRPGTDPEHVRPSDVLCDFCEHEWTDDLPMIEGHQGSCICGRCLTVAYSEVVLHATPGPADYTCPMCRESGDDRETLGRGEEPGWPSPARPEAVICRRCIEMAAAALHRDRDHDWRRPEPT